MASRTRLSLQARCVVVSIAVLTAAAAVGWLGAGGSVAALYPTLYVNYTMNCTFTIVNDSGAQVTSIPPGYYQVEVSTPIAFKLVTQPSTGPNDFTGCKGWVQFQLTGPGVNLATTLETGCDPTALLPTTYFAPNSTFTAQDNNQPAVTRTSFTTLGSGTPTAPSGQEGSQSSPAGSTPSTDIVGSAAATTVVGDLAATLNSTGKASLTLKGRNVSTLAPGLYRVVVADRDTRGSLVLTENGGPSTVLARAKFPGTRTVSVTLSTGIWRYSSSAGTSHSFVVS